MASPEGVTAGSDSVIISVYNGVSGFGIRAAPSYANAAVGTVYKIGYNVYNVLVGAKVGFKTDVSFATDAGETFATVSKENILITYAPAP